MRFFGILNISNVKIQSPVNTSPGGAGGVSWSPGALGSTPHSPVTTNGGVPTATTTTNENNIGILGMVQSSPIPIMASPTSGSNQGSPAHMNQIFFPPIMSSVAPISSVLNDQYSQIGNYHQQQHQQQGGGLVQQVGGVSLDACSCRWTWI